MGKEKQDQSVKEERHSLIAAYKFRHKRLMIIFYDGSLSIPAGIISFVCLFNHHAQHLTHN